MDLVKFAIRDYENHTGERLTGFRRHINEFSGGAHEPVTREEAIHKTYEYLCKTAGIKMDDVRHFVHTYDLKQSDPPCTEEDRLGKLVAPLVTAYNGQFKQRIQDAIDRREYSEAVEIFRDALEEEDDSESMDILRERLQELANEFAGGMVRRVYTKAELNELWPSVDRSCGRGNNAAIHHLENLGIVDANPCETSKDIRKDIIDTFNMTEDAQKADHLKWAGLAENDIQEVMDIWMGNPESLQVQRLLHEISVRKLTTIVNKMEFDAGDWFTKKNLRNMEQPSTAAALIVPDAEMEKMPKTPKMPVDIPITIPHITEPAVLERELEPEPDSLDYVLKKALAEDDAREAREAEYLTPPAFNAEYPPSPLGSESDSESDYEGEAQAKGQQIKTDRKAEAKCAIM